MLAELKDLMDKGLFSRVCLFSKTFFLLREFDVGGQTEAKVIMKKRREFEMALVRRVARKSDFLRYAAYEMDLERLRRKRTEKISECGPSGAVTSMGINHRYGAVPVDYRRKIAAVGVGLRDRQEGVSDL
jgi:plasmid maintenance system killer protein